MDINIRSKDNSGCGEATTLFFGSWCDSMGVCAIRQAGALGLEAFRAVHTLIMRPLFVSLHLRSDIVFNPRSLLSYSAFQTLTAEYHHADLAR